MVNPYLLKKASVEFAEPSLIIFENITKTGDVPKVLLHAHVARIFKKRATNDPGNYRPTSLTIRPSHMLEDRAKLKEDIDKISEWCSNWHICLNSEKCKMMSVGRSNLDVAYTLADKNGKKSQLTAVTSERDLVMVISTDLKPHDQAFLVDHKFLHILRV